MKIATWNIQRLDKNKSLSILEVISKVNADIFILTETNSSIHLEGYHDISTNLLPSAHDGIKYKVGENRVTIWTKYDILKRHETFDIYTSACADLDTPWGPLIVYGTIIGVFANQQPRFNNDMEGQRGDFEKLFPGKTACIAGDLNIMFSGYAYPSHKIRNILNDTFRKLNLTNTTASIKDNVEHIILSSDLLRDKEVSLEIWNEDKRLSDHIGICLTISTNPPVRSAPSPSPLYPSARC